MAAVPFVAGELGAVGAASGAGAASDPLFYLGPQLYQDAKWAARRIGKAWKHRSQTPKGRKRMRYSRPRTTQKFGEPVGSGSTQRAIVASNIGVSSSTRFLLSGDLLNIPKATNHEIDQRARDIINVKGIKLNVEVRNNLTEALYFNYAVIVPKYDQSASSVSVVDFFRSNEDARGTNFSNNLSGIEFSTLPINNDKYHILHHTRIMLGPSATSGGYSDATPNYFQLAKFLPVNRQIRFESGQPVNGRIQYCYWCDKFGGLPAASATAAAILFSQHNVAYFKNEV